MVRFRVPLPMVFLGLIGSLLNCQPVMEILYIVSIGSIVAGGVVSAFFAKRPSRFIMWLSAYLVLIEGVTQLGLVYLWQTLDFEVTSIVVIAFILFNFGNILVVLGRFKRGQISARPLVFAGGIFIGYAMAAFLWSVDYSTWNLKLGLLLVICAIILISMPIGLILTARRQNETS